MGRKYRKGGEIHNHYDNTWKIFAAIFWFIIGLAGLGFIMGQTEKNEKRREAEKEQQTSEYRP